MTHPIRNPWLREDGVEDPPIPSTHTFNIGDLALDREDRLCRIVNIVREDGVDFAWIRYTDGSNPQGLGAIDLDGGVCEHRLHDGEVTDDGYVTMRPEQGLRPLPTEETQVTLEGDGRREMDTHLEATHYLDDTLEIIQDAINLEPEAFDAPLTHGKLLEAALEVIWGHGFADDQAGSTDTTNHVFRVGRHVLETDSHGFKTVHSYGTESAAQALIDFVEKRETQDTVLRAVVPSLSTEPGHVRPDRLHFA